MKTVELSTSLFVNGLGQCLQTPLWHPRKFLKVVACPTGSNLSLRSEFTFLLYLHNFKQVDKLYLITIMGRLWFWVFAYLYHYGAALLCFVEEL